MKKYDWQRYWVTLGHNIHLTERGFLEDPKERYGKYLNSGLVELKDIEKEGGIVLLGEPGIGKSTEIKELYEKVDKQFAIWINLRDVLTAELFVKELTEDYKFKNWAEQDKPLYLFLDSFDEGSFLSNRFANYFFHLLSNNSSKLKNLYLRISSRTAVWPSYLTNQLLTLWEAENFHLLELCPLTKRDVELALDSRKIKKETFFSELQNKGVSGLASNPLTLKFLIDVFTENNGRLPDKKSDIYEQGCSILVKEPDLSRRNISSSVLSFSQRLAVAERIAAATLLCGKTTIILEDEEKLKDLEIGLSALYGREMLDDASFTVSDKEVREVLNTGLFSSRGDGKVGWAHQTYGEYLAARYVARHNLPWRQIKSLVFQDPLNIGSYQVIPQLYEISAWLGNLSSSFFDNAVLLDPEFLLLSDLGITTEQQRKSLTMQLLSKLDNGELIDRWETFNDSNYKKLKFENIEAELKPYIEDNKKSVIVRRAAIDIARACIVSALEETLVGIVLDKNENMSIRIHAARTIATIASKDAKVKLKKLLDDDFSDDKDDELKGNILRSLWPDTINGREVLSLITPPKKHSFFGSYYTFLTKEFPVGIKSEDILPALIWVEENAADLDHRDYVYGTLSDAILTKSLDQLSDNTVIQKLSKIIFTRISNFNNVVGDHSMSEKIVSEFQGKMDKEDAARKQILMELVELIRQKDDSKNRKGFLLYHRNKIQFLGSQDLNWFIEWLNKEESKEKQEIVADIVYNIFDIKDPNQIDAVYKASLHNDALKSAISLWFGSVELESELAKQQRSNWEQQIKWQQKRETSENEEILEKISIKNIKKLLSEAENGQLDSWWRLNVGLCVYQHETDENRFEDLPGWKILDDDIKQRIISVGRNFVEKESCKPEIWLGKGKIYYPAVSGFREIRELYDNDLKFLESQGTDFWKRWAAITLGMPLVSSDPENGKIIAMAYKHAPDEILETLGIIIDDDARNHDGLFINSLLEDCLDDRMQEFLLEKSKEENFSNKASMEILRFLLSNGSIGAKKYIKSKIQIPLPQDEAKKEEVITAAASLLQNADQRDWDLLWDLIKKDNNFGRELIIKAHDGPLRGSKVLQEINEVNLADLYIWLVKEFSPEEYARPEGGGTVTTEVSIADWRESVLRVLMEKGTVGSCEQIERLAFAMPQYPWIREYTLLEARRVTSQKSWEPTSVSQLLKLVENHELRIVNSADELMDIVIESLSRLGQKLQSGEHPSAIHIWNEVREDKKTTVYTPQNENRLSDYVKKHLEDDLKSQGIVINREVEIKRGNKTDIHISAFSHDELGRPVGGAMKVTIETKGCWHSDIDTAMERQLVGQYLSADKCRNGIYLVGWFLCEKWDHSDDRYKKTEKITVKEAQDKFAIQADSISEKTGYRVASVVLDIKI